MRSASIANLATTCSPSRTATNPENKTCSTHSPEVAGSNPVPATSENGPQATAWGPFSIWVDASSGPGPGPLIVEAADPSTQPGHRTCIAQDN